MDGKREPISRRENEQVSCQGVENYRHCLVLIDNEIPNNKLRYKWDIEALNGKSRLNMNRTQTTFY